MRNFPRQGLALLTSAALLGSCSLKQRDPGSVGLWVDVPQPGTASVNLSKSLVEGLGRSHDWGTLAVSAPTSVDDFHCYGLNVMGPGLARFQPPAPPPGVDPAQWTCNYPGVTSALVGTNGGAIQLQVPAGPARTIQMIGVRSDVACKLGMDLKQYEDEVHQQFPAANAASPSIILQEIGRTTVDLFSDASVEINSNYSENRGYPFNCGQPQNPELPLSILGAWGGGNAGTLLASTTPPPAALDIFYAATNTSTWDSTGFQSLPSANLLDLSNFTSNTAYFPAVMNPGSHGRWDVAFRVPSGTLVTNYKQLIVNVRAVGGTNTSCGGTTISANLGISFGVVNGANWDAGIAQNLTSAPDPVMAYSYGPNLTPYVKTYNFAGTSYDLIIVQVRANAGASSNCSKAILYSASAKLVP